MAAEYDKNDRESIIEYALKTKDKKISDLFDHEVMFNSKDKGSVGNLIQEHYFGIPRNSSIEPDFENAGIELKSFGYWDDGTSQRADQRLALSKIDFMEFEKEIPFEESHLYHKCHTMLLLAYLLKINQKRIDSEIKHVRLYEFDKLVQSDLNQIINILRKKFMMGRHPNFRKAIQSFWGLQGLGTRNQIWRLHREMIELCQEDLH